MIRLSHISKSFGSLKVFDDLSLEIADGESYVITGRSGVGKTTLIRILLGLEQIDSGEVVGLGQSCGVVFQDDRLLEDEDAVTNLALVQRRTNREVALEELELLLPASALDKPVKELSGGQRRRVSIARAMLSQSDILYMDEPFSGLDISTREEVVAYIKDRKGHRTLVITSHDLKGLDFCREINL